ncbi:MAG: hypothetical protein ACTHLW_20840 [Verrucomicrobiota bacterium]
MKPPQARANFTHQKTLHRALPQLAAAGLLLMANLSEAQVAVPVGGGSYASSLPPSVQWQGGYYSMTPQQVVTQYSVLHLAATATNRPLPSNQWWTDLLVGDRSYQAAANTPRTIVQDAFGGQLWAYPSMINPESFGLISIFPIPGCRRPPRNRGFRKARSTPVPRCKSRVACR